MKIYKGKRVLLPGGRLGPAAVYVEDGKIVDVVTQGAYQGKEEGVHEVSDLVIGCSHTISVCISTCRTHVYTSPGVFQYYKCAWL